MVPFADIDANGVAVIIAAFFVGVLQVTQMILSHFREQAKIVRDFTAAAKQAEIVEKVEVIHKATNSLVEKVVSSASAEGLARGANEERARADAAKPGPPK